MKRFALICLGCSATGAAIIGAVTPGVPSTPFLLVALWAFSQSSQRLHNWLMHTPILKNAMIEVQNYQEHKAIKKNVKIFAQVCAWGSFILVAFTSSILLVKIIVFFAALSSSIAMKRIKTLKEE